MPKKQPWNAVFYLFLITIIFLTCFPIAAAANAGESGGTNLEKLPLQVRYAVSAAMGRDRSSFHIKNNENKITARNNGQSYSVGFSEKGVLFHKGTSAWGMTLSGWGYGDDVVKAEAVIPYTEKNRVEYRRGNLTEWYVNGPLGVQQGFTIESAPKNRSEGESLQVHLHMTGGLKASVDSDERGLSLLDKNGASVFRYGGLTVIDAAGKELPARIVAEDEEFSIHVDDRQARYPLVIDPFIITPKLTAPVREVHNYFGCSVAVDGDTIVIGARRDNSYKGAAYVFVKPAGGWGGTSTPNAMLYASDGVASDYFGRSVAISGDTIAVGANGDDSNRGAAYVFVKPGSGWTDMTQTAKLTASDAATSDKLGVSVSISGNVVVVGADGDDSSRGAAYVYVMPGSEWTNMTQTAKLTASDGETYDNFGYSVAISGDTIVAGSYQDDDGGTWAGAAYVFVKPGGGWANMFQTAKLKASDAANGHFLGKAVSINGDTIAAGAGGVNNSRGAAYVFVKPGGGWVNMTQTAKLTASDAADSDNFGDSSVSISGDTIVVGSYKDDDNGDASGSAYLFVKPHSGWADMNEVAKWIASDGNGGDSFGWSVFFSGDTFVAGAPGDDTSSGAAYVFDLSPIHILEVAVSGAGSGTVTSSPAPINCPGIFCGYAFAGTDVTLTAAPNAGSVLVGWAGSDCPGNPTECTVTMDADKTVTATFETDTDGDGISDSSENGCPNGGDGNSDGFLDSWQPQVSSFQDISGNWVTMVTGAPIENVMASCNPSPGDIPAGVTPTCGFFGFKITGLVAGGSTTLTLVLHNQDTTINDYYKYGPTPTDGTNHWYQFLDDGTTGATISHADGKTYITLRLVDGGTGDDDLAANGTITDVGGPMVSAGSSGGGSSSAPASSGGGGGGGGCFMSVFN